VNFLKKYVSILEGTEVPPRFSIWCGISAISAMLERRIWLDMGIYHIFPNMFIILVAESGRARKSTAVKATKTLLYAVDPGPKLIAQKITPEALISSLRLVRKEDKDKKMQQSCGGIIIADELMTLINKKSYEAGLASLLIPFYDCEDKFTYETKSRGTETVDLAHLSLLGASTVNSIRESLPSAAIGDGFTSRVMFIYTNDIPPPVPWTEYSEEKSRTKEELVRYLENLASLKGKVTFTPEAKAFYIEEYERFHGSSDFYENPLLGAYASRRHTHHLKLSMCLMASEDPKTILEKSHLEGAKDIIEEAELHMSTVLNQIVTTDVGDMTEQVYQFISSRSPVPRSEVVSNFSHRLDAQSLGKILDTLLQGKKAKYGKVQVGSDQGQLIYKV